MEIQEYLIVVLRILYTDQEVTVCTEDGEIGGLQVGKGVRQGFIQRQCSTGVNMLNYVGLQAGKASFQQ